MDLLVEKPRKLPRTVDTVMSNVHQLTYVYRQTGSDFDGYAAANAVAARVEAEGWDVHDIRTALLQSSLLSYQSQSISAEDRAQSRWNQVWNPHGQRYVESSPADYEHNCPWNNWTPPSQSRRLFEAARAANARAGGASGVHARVRVRVHMALSVNSRELRETLLIAFATVEVNEHGANSLVLRRGSEMLACMPLHAISVRQEPTRERIFCVTALCPTDVSPCLYINIENERRLSAFVALFR